MNVSITRLWILLGAIIGGCQGTYNPTPGEFGHLSSAQQFEAFQDARETTDIHMARSKWEGVVGAAPWDDNREFDDITDQSLYVASVRELVRIYYLLGDTTNGDELFHHLLSIGITEVPSKEILRNMCFNERF